MSTVAPTEDDLQVPVPELLGKLLDRKGSDLHLTAGTPPVVRVHGELERLDEYPLLSPRALQGMIYAILPQKMRERFEQELELDMSYSLPGRARFRVNVFMQRDAVGAVFRVIPFDIQNMDELGLPPVASDLARFPRGFVVVTGPTGSGKSTTLAAMVDVVNTERAGHIMTVEDPIEFLHKHKKCVVNQREIGADTHSFASALKHVLRQDPDVILVGEMRDLETIATAITAAETGHLVFATLHTQDAPQTIDRIIDVFPPHQQQQVRVQLSTTLQGVVTQQLIPTADGQGRVVASEVMVATPGIRNLIREGKVHQVYSAMQAGGRYGMQTMDMSLAAHVKAGRITQQMAFERCHDPEELQRLIGSAAGLSAFAGASAFDDGTWATGSFQPSSDPFGSSNGS
ncbi:MAG TPA: type IV pilus twitching motility protein PilT [Actinomycetota bacterium]|nr:type IV pilus twitching motility protein PilT [Actinomycetota bacterium]